MSGRQWSHIELRCPSRVVRVPGKLPQASGDIYDDSTHFYINGGCCQDNGRVAFGACPGIEANQTRAIQ